MSPPERRGLLSAFYKIFSISGAFLSYVIGAIPGVVYHHSALVAIGILIVYEVLMFIPKESPRWLLMKNHKYAARKSLLWLFQSHETVKTLVTNMELSIANEKVSFCKKVKMFKKRSVYFPFVLSIFLVTFAEGTGIIVFLTYAALIFQTADISNARETAIYAVGVLQVLGTIISGIVVDKVGRKKLLLFGSIGIAISNAALGTQLFISDRLQCDNSTNHSGNVNDHQVFNSTDNVPESQCHSTLLSIMAIVSVMGFGLFYSVGWRALPSIVIGEMFPNYLRSFLNGLFYALKWVLSAILIGGFPPFEDAVHPYTVWWVFAGVTVLSIPFVLLLLPETKGKSLEEIEQYFNNKKRTLRDNVGVCNPALVNGNIVRLEEIEGHDHTEGKATVVETVKIYSNNIA